MKKTLIAILVTLAFLVAFSTADAQVTSKADWVDSVTTSAVDTVTIQTGQANVWITVWNVDSNSALYVWLDSTGTSTGLDSNKMFIIPAGKSIKFKAPAQKIYRKAKDAKGPSYIIIGDFTIGAIFRESARLDWRYI
jgi:hypothetical protein